MGRLRTHRYDNVDWSLPVKEIARQLGVSITAVYYARNMRGLPRLKRGRLPYLVGSTPRPPTYLPDGKANPAYSAWRYRIKQPIPKCRGAKRIEGQPASKLPDGRNNPEYWKWWSARRKARKENEKTVGPAGADQ